MAEYQVVIVSPQGETWDVTERVSTLTWSGISSPGRRPPRG